MHWHFEFIKGRSKLRRDLRKIQVNHVCCAKKNEIIGECLLEWEAGKNHESVCPPLHNPIN